jgi:hypothetical protein
LGPLGGGFGDFQNSENVKVLVDLKFDLGFSFPPLRKKASVSP